MNKPSKIAPTLHPSVGWIQPLDAGLRFFCWLGLGVGLLFTPFFGVRVLLAQEAKSPPSATSTTQQMVQIRQQALEAFREGRFEEARELYQQATTPERVEALLKAFRTVERDGVLLVEISVKEVLELTLYLSSTIAALRISEEAERRGVQAVENRLKPTWLHSYAQSRTLSRTGSTSNNYLDLSRRSTTTFTSTFAQPLPWGLRYSLRLQDSKSTPDHLALASQSASPVLTPGAAPETARSLSAELSVPLGKDLGNVYSTPERRARYRFNGTRHALRKQELDLLMSMATLYWSLLGAQEQVKTRQESLALSMRLLQESQARFAAGVVNRAAVLAARTQQANAKRQLLKAQADLQRIQDSARAVLNLRTLNVGLIPKDAFTQRFLTHDSEELKQQVLDNDATLGQLRAQFNTVELAVEEGRNELRPDVDLHLGYSQNGFGNSTAPSPKGGDLSGYQAVVTWNMTFFDGENTQALRANVLRRESLRLQMRDQESILLVNLNSILRELQIAEQDVLASRELSRLSKLERDNELLRLKQGQSTTSMMGSLQRDFSQAKVDEILARVKYEQTRIQFLGMTGALYDVFKLQSAMAKPLP